MARVAVTRPWADSEPLAAELSRRGYEPLIAPMLDIIPLETPLPALEGYDALAFTSANGVRAFARLSTDRRLPVYAVGARTAAAARAAGFGDTRTAPGDGAALVRSLAATLPSGAAALHVSGVAIARDLAEPLDKAGIRIDRVVLYEARPASALPADLADALYARTIEYVLFYSARTAGVFATLALTSGLGESVRSVSALCLSATVAGEAQRLPWLGVAAAARPTSKALLDLLPPLKA